jgi:signal transduction histidine kinase
LNNLKSEKGNYIALDSSFYGTILNNIALTKVASGNFDYDEIVATYKEAENISLEYEYPNGALNALLDLSDLYLQFEQYDSVMKYASESLKMATEFSSNEAKQRALMLLSEVTPGEQGKAYLKEHIRLGDSLEAEERLVRNKIARIKFDTDQLQARNEQISRENFYLLLVSIVLLLSGILIYVIFTQRARNKELRLKQVQQEANEEIYNLMLKQQDKIEEARALEKTRVSKELHDGVLGRLFGVRLSLDSLNFTEGKDAATNRSRYVSQLKTIEEDIRKISHEMNTDFVSGSGFVDVLKELVDTQAKAYGLDAEFTASEEVNWERVSNKVKINLYRIVQESMQNIYKHAKATKMSVAISLLNDDICLEVSDNGKGFDTSRQRRGIGLKNITSRVKDLKGSVVFESKSGKGTTVRVFLPQERV